MRLLIAILASCVGLSCSDAAPSDGKAPVDAGPADGVWPKADVGGADGTDVVGSDGGPLPFDIGDPDPGKIGAPCDSNDDCDSGYCIEGPDGYICTELCEDICPPGWSCKGIQSGGDDVAFICVPPPPSKASLCEPCVDHASCLGEGSACVAVDEAFYCGKACDGDEDCPEGYGCATLEGVQFPQCIPSSGSCQCMDLNLGLARTCTVEALGGDPNQPGALCTGLQVCESEGWGTCELPTETCDGIDNDCDGQIDEAYKNDGGLYGTVDHCGACGLSCLALQAANATPACDTSTGTALCTTICEGAWKDVDGETSNGCECLPSSDVDFPDEKGVDANCDGVDGEITNGIFVSKAGDDGNNGTLDAPLRTIQAGISKAQAQGKRDVYVATGVYQESVMLADAVGAYGGYSAAFDIRDLNAYQTAIIGGMPTPAAPGAVNAIDVGQSKTVFDGFSVFGSKESSPGGSTYAIYLKNVSPQLTVSNNVVVADDGTAGSSGSFGANGASGSTGADGVLAKNVGSQNCEGADEASGGGGGTKTCSGVPTNGGHGGSRICPNAPNDVQNANQTPQAEEAGGFGLNNLFGFGEGGDAGWDLLVGFSSCGVCSSSKNHPSAGSDGVNGIEGPAGGAGGACSNGQGSVNAAGLWIGAQGDTGDAGFAGGGGGGGGAGGGVDVKAECGYGKAVGGSGGGGGSGACPGTGGGLGHAGGATFGLFAYWANAPAAFPTVDGNTIYRGYGGAGGDGGPGGLGGSGGLGGAGGGSGQGQGDFPINFCGQSGGYGGVGGHGGAGGGGAGGCGGASYGFFAWTSGSNASTATMAQNDYPNSGGAGVGGKGGFSAVSGGPAGSNGSNGATNF